MVKRVQVGLFLAVLSLVVPALAWAQATGGSIFPVSSDLATVKSDVIAWSVALLAIVVAILAYRKIKGVAGR
jgi:hypothetical protein